jgi:UDP-N-acetylglucosamine 2-epimerase (hydrolysing)
MLNSKIRIFPSVRFEYFLVLLKYAKFIIGNSSAGIREAPYYGIPSVNIGTRQNNRSLNTEILNCNYDIFSISSSIQKAINSPKLAYSQHFGAGESDIKFIGILNTESFWAISKQKVFKDI